MASGRRKVWWWSGGGVLGVLAVGLFVFRPAPRLQFQGKTVPVLCEQLAYGSADERRHAELGVKSLGKTVVPELVRLLGTSDFGMRPKLWRWLPSLPPGVRDFLAPRMLPPDHSNTLKVGALRSLGILGAEAASAAPQIARLLHDSDESVALESARALASLGSEGLSQVVPRLHDPSPSVRQKAALSLSQMTPVPPQIEGVLLELLGDDHEQVRLTAALALSSVGPGALAGILATVETGQGNARIAAAKALGWMHASRRRSVPALLTMLHDSNPKVREQAIQTLGDIYANEDRVRAAMIAELQDSDSKVRTAATNVLRQFGMRAADLGVGSYDGKKSGSP